MRASFAKRQMERLTYDKKGLHRKVLQICESFQEVDKTLQENPFKKDNPLKKGNPKKSPTKKKNKWRK